MWSIFLSLLWIPFFCFADPIAYFTPPKDWNCIQPPTSDPYIRIAFLGKGQSDLRPSLNLAIEKTDVSLKEYLKSVKSIHENEMKVSWRDLGPFTFIAGKGRLAEIISPSPLGDVIMLQGIFIQEGYAYILTGAVLKEEFPQWQKNLLDALHSLVIVPNLFSAIRDSSLKKQLQETFHSFDRMTNEEERQKQWSVLQKMILNDFSSMGLHWQILVLKDGRQKLFPDESKYIQ